MSPSDSRNNPSFCLRKYLTTVRIARTPYDDYRDELASLPRFVARGLVKRRGNRVKARITSAFIRGSAKRTRLWLWGVTDVRSNADAVPGDGSLARRACPCPGPGG